MLVEVLPLMLAGGSHLYRGGKKAQMPALMLSLGQLLLDLDLYMFNGAKLWDLLVIWRSRSS